VLVGYAAETGDAVEHARVKLAQKNLDLIVANDVTDPALGFASDSNRVWFVGADEVEELPVMSKRSIARALWDRVAPSAQVAAAARAGRSEA
jgi:phosphopantothenoylcysteine decarboxylase/phosphopantothenate--cysteine ligase